TTKIRVVSCGAWVTYRGVPPKAGTTGTKEMGVSAAAAPASVTAPRNANDTTREINGWRNGPDALRAAFSRMATLRRGSIGDLAGLIDAIAGGEVCYSIIHI